LSSTRLKPPKYIPTEEDGDPQLKFKFYKTLKECVTYAQE